MSVFFKKNIVLCVSRHSIKSLPTFNNLQSKGNDGFEQDESPKPIILRNGNANKIALKWLNYSDFKSNKNIIIFNSQFSDMKNIFLQRYTFSSAPQNWITAVKWRQ